MEKNEGSEVGEVAGVVGEANREEVVEEAEGVASIEQ